MLDRFIDIDSGLVVGQHSAYEYYTVGQRAMIPSVANRYYVVGRKKNAILSTPPQALVVENMLCADIKQVASNRIPSNCEIADVGASDAAVTGDVYIAQGADHPALYSPYILQPLSSINWIAGTAPQALLRQLQLSRDSGDASLVQEEYRCECKCRYSQLPTPCSITVVPADPSLARYTTGDEAMLKVVFDDHQRAITAGQIIALYDGEVCLGGAVIAEQPLFLGEDKEPVYL
jgi:tRNA U34 2-thiouridine synthase MnmA/TrmU